MRARIFSIILLIPLILASSSASAFETTPADGETGFPVDGEIIIEFDDPMDVGTVDVDFSPDTVYPVQEVWSDDNRVLTLRPTATLLEYSIYTVHVSGEDENGGAVGEVFSFETGSTSTQDESEEISGYGILIVMFTIVIIVTLIAVFISLKRIRQKKEH